MSSSSAACGEPVYAPTGRQGISVNQPQSGLDYPLVDPSEDIRYLIADLDLEFEDPSDYNTTASPFVYPFHVAWLYGLGCEVNDQPLWVPSPINPVEIVIHDADGETVFDSTTAEYFDEVEWGNYKIYEWRTDASVLRLVTYINWAPDQTDFVRNYALHIEPSRARIDARAVYRLPKRVRSLRLVLDTFTKTNIDFVSGYNVSLERATPEALPGQRNIEQVTINATPGAGNGLFPGCTEQDVVLRRINGVGPTTQGDFLLAAAECYWVRMPTTLVDADPLTVRPTIDITPVSGHLQLGNDCTPCCPCPSYVETAQYLNRLWLDGVAVGQAAEATRDLYHQNRERWTEAKRCIELRPLRLLLRPQNCPYLDVVAQYCNQTDECKLDVTLIIRFVAQPAIIPDCACDDAPTCDGVVPGLPDGLSAAQVQVVCGHTVVSGGAGGDRYSLEGDWCEYRAHFDAVNPFSSVFVKFRLKFPNDGKDTPEGGVEAAAYAISGCLRASIGNNWLCIPPENPQTVAVDTQSATLECGGGGGNGLLEC